MDLTTTPSGHAAAFAALMKVFKATCGCLERGCPEAVDKPSHKSLFPKQIWAVLVHGDILDT